MFKPSSSFSTASLEATLVPQESNEHSQWRKDFDAMSPVQKRMVVERNPAEFKPSQREVFWRALLDEEDSNKRDTREEETLSIARQARSDSRRANNIEISAMILSTAIAIIAIVIGVIFAR